jgi:threonine 3-dehydrogenase
MRALVKTERAPGLVLKEMPVPKIGPNDLLIKVHKAAICGTDLHIYGWDAWAQKTIPVPMIVGHEFTGEVADLGSEVTGFVKCERVSGEGHITCGHCRNCRAGKRHLCRNTVGIGVHRDGCFADYLALPAMNAFKVPKEIPDTLSAFFDPLGNAVHTALSFDLVGEDVLITGAGPIGCMAAAIAKHIGARHVVVTDVNEYRLGLAKKLGATRTVNVGTTKLEAVMSELGMTEGFDVGMEMSGNPSAIRSLFTAMNNGGRVALLGLPSNEITVDLNEIIFKGLILKGIYGREMFETWYKMVAMLQSGLDVSGVLTHRFPLAEFEKAFEATRSGQTGKVILELDG